MKTAGGVHPTHEKPKFRKEIIWRKIYSLFWILTIGK
jgi:hypothetical protein